MSQPDENYAETRDQLARKVASSCWFCRRPWVSGRITIGSNGPNGGTSVPACAAGTGCRDGRISHGPPHDMPPHWPNEPCAICTADRQRKATANRSRSVQRRDTTNRSPRHR